MIAHSLTLLPFRLPAQCCPCWRVKLLLASFPRNGLFGFSPAFAFESL